MPFRLVDYWSRTQEIDEDAFVITQMNGGRQAPL